MKVNKKQIGIAITVIVIILLTLFAGVMLLTSVGLHTNSVNTVFAQGMTKINEGQFKLLDDGGEPTGEAIAGYEDLYGVVYAPNGEGYAKVIGYILADMSNNAEITIPSTIRFSGEENDRAINLVDKYAFRNCEKLIAVWCENAGLGEGCFELCRNLTRFNSHVNGECILYSSNLISDDYGTGYWEDDAFYCDLNITKIIINELGFIDGCLFDYDGEDIHVDLYINGLANVNIDSGRIVWNSNTDVSQNNDVASKLLFSVVCNCEDLTIHLTANLYDQLDDWVANHQDYEVGEDLTLADVGFTSLSTDIIAFVREGGVPQTGVVLDVILPNFVILMTLAIVMVWKKKEEY